MLLVNNLLLNFRSPRNGFWKRSTPHPPHAWKRSTPQTWFFLSKQKTHTIYKTANILNLPHNIYIFCFALHIAMRWMKSYIFHFFYKNINDITWRKVNIIAPLPQMLLTTYFHFFACPGLVCGRDQLPIHPTLERDQLLKHGFSWANKKHRMRKK